MATTRRKIHFYRADCGAVDGTLNVFPWKKVLADIGTHAAPRMARGEHPDLVAWVHTPKHSKGYGHLKIGATRRRALPEVEQHAKLSPLKLAQDAGINDSAHVVFFPDNNIVGMEFNFYGPRTGALCDYLQTKSASCPSFRFERLLRDDWQDRLNSLDEITMFHLEVRPSYSAEIRRYSKNLADMLDSAGRFGKTSTVEVVLKSAPRSGEDVGVKGIIKRMFQGKTFRDDARKLRVRGIDSNTGGSEEYNLLQDALISSADMVLLDGRSRSVSADSAFDAIERAYEKQKRQIIDAATVY